MFFTRLFSSFILIIATVLLGIFGDLPLILGLSIISIIGLSEFYKVFGFHKKKLAFFLYIIAACYEALLYLTSGIMFFSIFMILLMVALMVYYVLLYPKYNINDIMVAFFGFFYVVVLLSFIYIIRLLEGGEYLFWLIFIAAWGSDTLAYCTGMLFGKHKMTPNLSPKKSVEGAIGGIIGAGILGLVFALIFQKELSSVFSAPIVATVIIVIVTAIISIFGDLAASAVKRNYDIKDFGKIIPGHGGVLDRFDSIIITAPALLLVYLIVKVFGL